MLTLSHYDLSGQSKRISSFRKRFSLHNIFRRGSSASASTNSSRRQGGKRRLSLFGKVRSDANNNRHVVGASCDELSAAADYFKSGSSFPDLPATPSPPPPRSAPFRWLRRKRAMTASGASTPRGRQSESRRPSAISLCASSLASPSSSSSNRSVSTASFEHLSVSNSGTNADTTVFENPTYQIPRDLTRLRRNRIITNVAAFRQRSCQK